MRRFIAILFFLFVGVFYNSAFALRSETEECPEIVRDAANFNWGGIDIKPGFENFYSDKEKQVYQDKESLQKYKEKAVRAFDDESLIRDWEYVKPLQCGEKGCSLSCGLYSTLCKNGQKLKDCSESVYKCELYRHIEEEYEKFMIDKICGTIIDCANELRENPFTDRARFGVMCSTSTVTEQLKSDWDAACTNAYKNKNAYGKSEAKKWVMLDGFTVFRCIKGECLPGYDNVNSQCVEKSGSRQRTSSSDKSYAEKSVKVIDCKTELEKKSVKVGSVVKCHTSTATGGQVYNQVVGNWRNACMRAIASLHGVGQMDKEEQGEYTVFTCKMNDCQKDYENKKGKCVEKAKSQQKSVEIKSIVDEINASANQMKIGHILPSDDVKHSLDKDVKSAIAAWDKACLEITKPDGVETTDIEKGFSVKDGGGANARRCIVKSCKTSEGYKRSSDKTKCEKTNSSTQNDDTDKQNNQTKQDKQRERKITEFTSIIEESIKSGVKIGTSVTVPNDADLNYSDGRVDERIDAALDLWLEECKKSKTEGVVEAAVLDDRKTPKKTLTCYIKDCEKGYHKDGNVCLEDGVVQLSDEQIKCEQDGGNWNKKSNKCQKIRQTKEAKEREKCAKNENKLWLPGEGCVENNEENRKKEANLYKDEDDVDNICYGETKEKHQNLYDEAVKKIKAAYKAKAEEIIDDCKNNKKGTMNPETLQCDVPEAEE